MVPQLRGKHAGDTGHIGASGVDHTGAEQLSQAGAGKPAPENVRLGVGPGRNGRRRVRPTEHRCGTAPTAMEPVNTRSC